MNDIALVDKAGLKLGPPDGASSGPPNGLSDSVLAGSTALVVLGMHRSGTSALTGMLHRLGVALGEHLMPATNDNPRGYWEHADIVKVHERLMAALGWERGKTSARCRAVSRTARRRGRRAAN